jgi:hypothetical protein
MPKAAEFKISKIEGRKTPYRLDIPANWSETGKRQRKFFETKVAANGYAAAQRKKRRDGRERETLLPDTIRRQADQAVRLLPDGVSLIDAVKAFSEARSVLSAVGETDIVHAVGKYAENSSARMKSIPFSELLPLFAEAPTKKTRRPKAKAYQTAITGFANHLNPLLGAELLTDIDRDKLEKAVTESTIQERSRESVFKVLKAAFNFAIRRGWAKSNPCDGIEWFSNDIEDAKIPTPMQSRALLESADTPEVQAYIAICLFAGTRESETRRLRWENLHWDSEEIELKAAPGRKAATGRFIRFEKNLQEWLKPLRKKSGFICGESL